MARRSIFTVGGTVQAGGGRYLFRKVDDRLLSLCRSGTFAFVLTARQMGKSSLMVQTARRLAEEGTRSVIIDLSQIGVQITPEAWYFGLLTIMEEVLDLDTDVYSWWEDQVNLGLAQRLTLFFKEVLLQEVDEPVVIFFDEIDSTLSLPFTDDFFAAIRSVYNARSSHTDFNRLSFVMIGVASPIDLISDATRTPFNIGERVDVEYFTEAEAMPLAEGFNLPGEEARDVVRWILDWTGGHPYLTQRLCYVVAEQNASQVTRADVDQAVALAYLGERGEQDSNLRFVHDMLTRRTEDPLLVLTTYRDIYQGRLVKDDRQSTTLTHLKLSGVVRRENGQLRVSNTIYERVFDRTWLKRQWPEHWLKRVPPAVLGLVASAFIAVILLGLFLFQSQQAQTAIEQADLQATLNKQLSDELNTSDSLRTETQQANRRLANEFSRTDSLRKETERINLQLVSQFLVTDSLRNVAEAANAALLNQLQVTDSLNAELFTQIEVSDSLRGIAETRLNDAQAARLETITIALANKAERQLKLGDATLGALLARQAYLFSQEGEGEFLAPVYDALLQTLNALDAETPAGGPMVVSDLQAGVRSVAYSPDGRWTVAADDAGGLVLWPTDNPAPSTMRRLDGHRASVRALAFSPDGSLLATGGDDQVVQLWRNLDQASPDVERLGTHQGGIWTLAFTPDGQHLASAGADRSVSIWSVAEPGDPVVLDVGTNVRVRSLAFSPNGATLVLGCEDGMLQQWDWQVPSQPSTTWTSGQGRLHSVVFNAAGDLLATGGDDPVVRLWKMDTKPVVERELRGHEGPINALAFSPDGTQLASGSSDHSVQIWDIEHPNRSPMLLQEHTAWVQALAFSTDGSRLASAGTDRTVRIWNTRLNELATRICDAAGRELTPAEWDQHVGEDFPFNHHYQPCAQTASEGVISNRKQP